MRVFSAIALLLLASAATAQAFELEDLDTLVDLQAVPGSDIVPRLLRELGLGDAPAPGAYAQAASPAAAATPGAYSSVTPTMQEAASKPVETPVAAAAPQVIDQPTAVAAGASPSAGTCPADTRKVSYTAGTLFCVLGSASAEQGEVYVTMDGKKGKVAVPTDNKCFVAACIETMDAVQTTKSQAAMMGGMNRKLKLVQGAEVTPFVMKVEEASTTPVKLSNSKCFFVCESEKQGPITVVKP